MSKVASPTPGRQYRAAYEVLPAMKKEAEFYLRLSPSQAFVLAWPVRVASPCTQSPRPPMRRS